jgi:hypothetical protein
MNNINRNIVNYFQKNNLSISNIQTEKESKEYTATRFQLNEKNIIFRTGKSTPTKQGFFVTCWKRNQDNITIPFDIEDNFDELMIYVENENNNIKGVFIFPKQILLENKIITNTRLNQVKGKNGFRLYTTELTDLNKQASKSQIWQKEYYLILK